MLADWRRKTAENCWWRREPNFLRRARVPGKCYYEKD